jgi:hypothetical protein
MALEGPDRRMVPALAEEQIRFHLVADVERTRTSSSEIATREDTTGGATAAPVIKGRAARSLVSRLEPDAASQGARRTAEVPLDNAPHRRVLKKSA